jgi:hypothetical protein
MDKRETETETSQPRKGRKNNSITEYVLVPNVALVHDEDGGAVEVDDVLAPEPRIDTLELLDSSLHHVLPDLHAIEEAQSQGRKAHAGHHAAAEVLGQPAIAVTASIVPIGWLVG